MNSVNDQAAGEPGATVSAWRSHYTLAILTIIYALNHLDRSIFSIVLQSIKMEMDLSDKALGLIGGLAFVMFYATLGVPIAYLADRYSRKIIITAGLTLWSMMTAFTGLVNGVWQLALARFLMGAGEACGTAPSNSMLADLYDKARRPLALSVLTSGSTLGVFFGYLVGGWVNELYGWRIAFLVAGVPGLLIAALFYLTVREPPRGAHEPVGLSLDAGTFMDGVRFLAGSKTYIFVLLGGCLSGIHMYGVIIWGPTFLMRVHDLTSGAAGSYLGVARGPVGVVGIILGGLLADRLGRRDERWRVWVPALGILLSIPMEIVYLLAGPLWLAVIGMMMSTFFTSMHMGPLYAILMNVAKVRMRAVATATFMFFGNLTGLTLGPWGIGYLNDVMAADFGAHAIRYSLLIGTGFALLGGILMWRGSRYVAADARRALT
jgi:MFS family permease